MNDVGAARALFARVLDAWAAERNGRVSEREREVLYLAVVPGHLADELDSGL